MLRRSARLAGKPAGLSSIPPSFSSTGLTTQVDNELSSEPVATMTTAATTTTVKATSVAQRKRKHDDDTEMPDMKKSRTL
jgi:hypothetical protein